MTDLRRWPRADAILERALELPAAARAAYLAEAAEGDDELLRALSAVLDEQNATDGFLAPGGALSGPVFDELERRLADLEASRRLTAGQRIGPFDVQGELGRGGMGEVYRARDTQLHRDVALKVLPERFQLDPERRARFEREARLLATLNHPNIGAIYGFVELDGINMLVLELVEGVTLEERLADSPSGLPFSMVAAIGTQLASALEAAHARGIVHRDLKPANIKVTESGDLKVLDFGLSKALGGPAALTDSLTKKHRPGAVLGTAAYMSPEQVKGETVDPRTDIWTFGCVIFEALTGRRAFDGDSAPAVMERVLEQEPELHRLPAGTPSVLRELLRRCLVKDARRRLPTIGEARHALQQLLRPAGRQPTAAQRDPRRVDGRWLAWMSAALVAGALLGVGLRTDRSAEGPAHAPALTRLALPLPSTLADHPQALALSPDARMVVYVAAGGDGTRVFARDLDSLEPVPVADSEGARGVIVSPDGRWIGWFGTRGVFRVPATGGAATRIAVEPDVGSASWADDGSIVAAGAAQGLRRLRADARPETLSVVDASRGETAHRFPDVLPASRAMLFEIAYESGSRRIAWLDLESGTIRPITEGTQPHYVRTRHLVWRHAGSLLATTFDPDRGEIIGEPTPLTDGRRATGLMTGSPAFSVTATGLLGYVEAGGDAPPRLQLVLGWTGSPP